MIKETSDNQSIFCGQLTEIRNRKPWHCFLQWLPWAQSNGSQGLRTPLMHQPPACESLGLESLLRHRAWAGEEGEMWAVHLWGKWEILRAVLPLFTHCCSLILTLCHFTIRTLVKIYKDLWMPSEIVTICCSSSVLLFITNVRF